MKKIIPLLCLLSIISLYSETFNLIINKKNYKDSIVIKPFVDLSTPSEAIAYTSCKKIMESGDSTGDGIYSINNGTKDYDVY
jgi:hypothetical protein